MSLRIHGEVAHSLDLDQAGLAALPGQIPDVGALIAGRQGAGVRLASLLERAQVKDAARFATLTSSDGKFCATVPLSAVREALIVYRLDDAELPQKLGGPFRFLIPDVESCAVSEQAAVDKCANVKFLADIELTREPGEDSRPSTERAHRALHDKV